MRRKLGIVVEELEIEKVMKAKSQDEAGSEFDLLHSKVKDKIEQEKDSESAEEEAADSESIPSEVNDSPPEDAGDPEDIDDANSALEHFLCYHRAAIHIAISTEDVFTSETAKYLGSKAIDGLSAAKNAIVEYGPVALKHVYKGIALAIERTFNALTAGAIAITAYIEKRLKSFERIKSNITKARETLDLIKDFESPSEKITDIKIIDELVISEQIDYLKNLAVAAIFFNDYFSNIDNNVTNNLKSIKLLTENVIKSNHDLPNEIVNDRPKINNFIKQSITGYKTNNEFLDSYCYRNLLPGNLMFIGYLPNEYLTEYSELLSAYSHSKLFLGFSQNSAKEVKEIPYPDKDTLDNLLNELDSFCNRCIEIKDTVEKINKIRKDLLKPLSVYQTFLLKSKNKLSIRESLAEYISVKISYLDNTSIAGILLILDYVNRLLNANLKIVKLSIESQT